MRAELVDRILAGCQALIVVAFLVLVVGGYAYYLFPVEAQGRSPLACGDSVSISVALAATTSVVDPTAAQRINVCGFILNGAGATTVKFVRGTGATCGTGTADVTGAMKLIDGSTIAHGSGTGAVFRLPAADRLCLVNSGAVQVSGVLIYAKER